MPAARYFRCDLLPLEGALRGMGISQLRRLKELEAEHARLKKMYADLALTHQALQDVVAKKL